MKTQGDLYTHITSVTMGQQMPNITRGLWIGKQEPTHNVMTHVHAITTVQSLSFEVYLTTRFSSHITLHSFISTYSTGKFTENYPGKIVHGN